MNKYFAYLLHRGDYYNIYHADKIIEQSMLSLKEKTFVRQFLIDVSKRDIAGVLRMKDNERKLIYTKYKYDKAIKPLNLLNINPVLIPKNLQGASRLENKFNSYLSNL